MNYTLNILTSTPEKPIKHDFETLSECIIELIKSKSTVFEIYYHHPTCGTIKIASNY